MYAINADDLFLKNIVKSHLAKEFQADLSHFEKLTAVLYWVGNKEFVFKSRLVQELVVAVAADGAGECVDLLW